MITSAGDNFRLFFDSLHIQPDQKIIASTTFFENSDPDYMLMRYLPNGDLDTSFGLNGIVKTNLGYEQLAATNLLADGKIMAGGSAKTNGTDNHIFLARYLGNGQLDPSFGSGGTVIELIDSETLKVFEIRTQEDGKILVPYFTIENFVNKFKLNRYLPNGDLDTTFGNGGVVEMDSNGEMFYASLTLQPDGKILQSYKGRGQQTVKIRRLLNDGSVDTSFGTDGIVQIYDDMLIAFKILVEDDGDLVVFGPTYGFEADDNYTYRFKPDGAIDYTFGTNGHTSLGFEGSDIAFQANGKILITGNTFFYSGGGERFVVARLINGPLSVSEFENNSYKIYPNPSNGIFTIECELFSEKMPFQITDITGKIISSGELTEKQSQLNLTAAQSGVYFLKTQNGVFRLLKN